MLSEIILSTLGYPSVCRIRWQPRLYETVITISIALKLHKDEHQNF
jgi:hypothetical protein